MSCGPDGHAGCSRRRRSASPSRPAPSSRSPRRAAADGASAPRATPRRALRTSKTASSRGGTAGGAGIRRRADMYRIGIDVGGTFTDLVAVDEGGRVTIAKSASTPADPSLGVMEGLGLLAAALGVELRALLAATDLVVHGTTVATNALLERKGARAGMLTTQG